MVLRLFSPPSSMERSPPCPPDLDHQAHSRKGIGENSRTISQTRSSDTFESWLDMMTVFVSVGRTGGVGWEFRWFAGRDAALFASRIMFDMSKLSVWAQNGAAVSCIRRGRCMWRCHGDLATIETLATLKCASGSVRGETPNVSWLRRVASSPQDHDDQTQPC